MMVSLLAEYFGCSKMTLRRDIKELVQAEQVTKVHGGVILNREQERQPGHSRRVNQNVELKQRIGAEAAKLIHEGECVFFDAGSTSLYAAINVPPKLNFTAITNSLVTAVELCKKPGVNVVMMGGEVYKSVFATKYNRAVDSANRFRVDLALISTKIIILPEGLYETDLSMIEVKLAIIERAARVVVIADHTKFEGSGLCLSVPISAIDHIITDDGLPQEYADWLINAGIT
jgi:DeoR/GlpR family transcriptional regulator of sugar metabolism